MGGSTIPDVQVRLLGPVEIIRDGRASVAVGGPKERALLAYLALRPNEVASEDALVNALWADEPPRTAARTLQAYLSRLRKVLAEATNDDGGLVALESRPGGWMLRADADAIDVTAVEAVRARAHAASSGGDVATAALVLADALRCWRGPALVEFSDSLWAVASAVRLEELRLHLVEERIDADLACGRHASLVGELDALCSAHPLRERFWSQRMLALYRSGRQAEALRAYQEVRAALADELGIDPSPALARLEQRILQQDPTLEDASPAKTVEPVGAVVAPLAAPPDSPAVRQLPAAVAGLRERAFVGRDVELAELEAAWKRACDGELEVVLLAGEPGIGKTTLAVQQAAAAGDAGAIVLFGRCDEESLVPFQPFVEALAHLVVSTPPAALRSQLGAQAADLALLVPDLGRIIPEVADVMPTGAETERYRLFEAVPSLLRAASAEAPVLLVLDDLHWADRPTLQLLQHLIRRSVGTALLVLGTYRDTDLVRTHPLA
ncbi:MAG: hypothetical protein QOI47_2348, partial [Actinomycetota bacterium]|nr:hypothetical protein [Actinomycetota bacterium]